MVCCFLCGDWIFLLIKEDIDSLLSSGYSFQEFDGAVITILGGTGFIGQWVIQALHEYGLSYGFSSEIRVITRNSDAARKLFHGELSQQLKFLEFDFTTGSIDLEESDFFINGSTPSTRRTGIDNGEAVYSSTLNAAESIIQSAKKYRNKPKVVNLSSGIVYGQQEMTEGNQPETSVSSQPNSQSGYLNAKLASEVVFSEASVAALVTSISPRLYAFAGPGIVLDEHFAVGNFLRDGLLGEPIRISGNPATLRSYMYPTDLTRWILFALLHPKDVNVNIGSESSITMFELASLISDLTSKKGVEIFDKNSVPSNYVPSTSRFREMYGVSQQIDLNMGIERWIKWLWQSKK
jgi:nucleoside-diphosphate-sugar epimerase